jgi:DNA polymerase-3 subunit epsilon
MKYAIIDIETNGGGRQGNRITEIAIFIHDGEKIIDEFCSLVNPEANIPNFITGLTGIDNDMVARSPKFYEIAKQVYEITKDTVFVAHNVNFDYRIIAAEFKSLGAVFKRKKLCTVRLSRKLIPGLNSYSLGKLCNSLEIPLSDRHRARGDAAATVILFEKLLASDPSNLIQKELNPKSMGGTLPPLLDKEVVDALPKNHGVYYFKDAQGQILYIGKANNIRARVLSHFHDKSNREQKLCQQTAALDHKETGSELLALLLESAEIKKHLPKFNRAQRRSKDNYGIFTYSNQKGIQHLAYGPLKGIKKSLSTFANAQACRAFLEKLCEKYELCPKYCQLQQTNSSCFHYQVQNCRGVCSDKENIEQYNIRVNQAIKEIYSEPRTYIIRQKGRSEDEAALVQVENGIYKGYGYTNFSDLENQKVEEPEEQYKILTSHIAAQNHNKDVMRIINAFIRKGAQPESINYYEKPSLDLASLF